MQKTWSGVRPGLLLWDNPLFMVLKLLWTFLHYKAEYMLHKVNLKLELNCPKNFRRTLIQEYMRKKNKTNQLNRTVILIHHCPIYLPGEEQLHHVNQCMFSWFPEKLCQHRGEMYIRNRQTVTKKQDTDREVRASQTDILTNLNRSLNTAELIN